MTKIKGLFGAAETAPFQNSSCHQPVPLRNAWRTVLVALLLSLVSTAAPPPQPAQHDALQPILEYIDHAWGALLRSPIDCSTVLDAKTHKSLLYFPADMPVPAAARQLPAKCGVKIQHLPTVLHRLGEVDMKQIHAYGLLYLPNRYVVPGGFFNEMYGWDSYFIILGLLRAGRVDLARGMVDNFFFEIEHYGAVLNANRGYFLTRSQPPFLTCMILAVHDAARAAGQDDRAWLSTAYDYAVREHELWTREPHLAGNTGLSRYFDFGDGPVPEIIEAHEPYYTEVERQMASRDLMNGYLTVQAGISTPPEWPRFLLCPPGTRSQSTCPLKTVAFTRDYYKGDRSMRESGFDVSFRFGPFGAATHHYAPVCLNSLLFKAEKDLAALARLLGRDAEATRWQERAAARRAAINKYLWDPQAGMFFDYDFDQGVRSSYVYATTVYPLWAGLASDEQARAVVANLKKLEQPGGLAMSERVTGVQWDLPYGWAPIQLLAVEGLRRYGFQEQADSIAYSFLSMVLENFQRDGTMREKYNVVTRSSEVKVTAGYKSNVIGFGWTNGVFLELLHDLPAQWREQLEQASAAAAH
jgi:alpha,alpha-trehalase